MKMNLGNLFLDSNEVRVKLKLINTKNKKTSIKINNKYNNKPKTFNTKKIFYKNFTSILVFQHFYN